MQSAAKHSLDEMLRLIIERADRIVPILADTNQPLEGGSFAEFAQDAKEADLAFEPSDLSERTYEFLESRSFQI